MEYRILGPVEALDAGVPLPLGGPRQRALLALLLLHRNESLAAERLVEELWGSRPPRTAVAALQNKIGQFRRVLGAERLVTRPRGYCLRVEEGELDLERFEGLVQTSAGLEPPARAETLREALALWRGPALAGAELEHSLELAAARLEDERLAAVEQRIEADLALGRHAELAGELTALVAEHPLRERLRGYLVLALYRSGRQADALAAYHDARRYLADELGLEPTPALRRLERAILLHDPSVGAPPAAVAPPLGTAANGNGAAAEPPPMAPPRRTRWSGRRAVALAGAGAVLAALSVAVAFAARPTRLASGPPHSVTVLASESGRLLESVGAGTEPGPIALGEGALWVGDVDDETLLRIDLETLRVVRTIGLGVVPSEIVVADGTVWITSASEGVLLRLNASTDDVEARIDLGDGGRGAAPVAVGPSGVWVGNENAFTLLRIDPATSDVVSRLEGISAKSIAATSRDVWVLESTTPEVLRFDPSNGEIVARIRVGQGAWSLAADDAGVWIGDVHEDAVWWVDPVTESVKRTLPVGEDPRRIVVAREGYVWTANATDGSVSRIDAATGETASFAVSTAVDGVAPGRDRVWVSVP